MSDELYLLPDGMEQSGRTSYRTGESAEEVRGHVNRVQANASSYGGATSFVNSLNSARSRHARGASRAAEDRGTIGDIDHGVAGHGRDMDAAAASQLRSASAPPPPDQGIADSI